MNILFISFEYPPYSGGIGEYTFQISSRFHQEHDCQVVVLTSSNHKSDEAVSQFDSSHSHPVIRFKEMPFRATKPLYYGMTTLSRIFEAIKTYLKTKPDMVFACDKSSSYLAYILKKLFKVNYVVMGHGSEFLQYSSLFAAALNQAKHIFLNSDLSKQYLVKNFDYPNSKVSVIPLGADEKIYHQNDSDFASKAEKLRAKLGISKDSIILLTVGTVSDRKGQDLVISALPQIIKNTHKNISYIVAGRLKDKSIIKLIHDYGLEKNVICTDFIDREQLPLLYYLSDIYIQPSRQSKQIQELEGFSISTCEALLMNNVVIITNSMGIKDIIEQEKTGFIISSDDCKALANIVTDLINYPEKINVIAHQGNAMAVQNLTWSKTAKTTFSLLEKSYKTIEEKVS